MVLEKEIKKADYENIREIRKTKELYEYAQRCGVVSEVAEEIYKEEWKKLKKK